MDDQVKDQYPDAIENFLSEQEGKDLNVYVNSGGGSVFAGIAIYNMIKRHAAKANVKVYVDGLAGSIASILAFAGSEPPEIPSNAFLMIHNPWSYCEGNAEDMRKMADDLDQIKTGILNIYAEHLKEETPLLCKHAQVDAWHAQVDHVRDDVARADKRLARLEAALAPRLSAPAHPD